ncbi:hypothetical protein AADG42_08130 [Ammonicoccus fulvus]|uniref:Chemotaxis methyl-accepting receptor HlyB-like 4HB MCP domain-containing protein n=1 Tax=Ammonicoccus fulvus TaxID=3138240 RepID=A0ABZ3FQY1_9ACTN
MTAAASPPTQASTPTATSSSVPARVGSQPPAVAPPTVEVVPARQPPTPSLLRVLMVVTVLSVLLFAGAAVGGLVTVRSSTTEAAATADQISRLQQIRIELQRADARALEHVLAGQGEDDTPSYRESLATARRLIIDAADADPGERETLRSVNSALDDYTTLLERARLGGESPDGLNALANSSVILRTQVEEPLDMLVTGNEEQLQRQGVRIPAIVVTGTGALALFCLLGTATVVLVRFRRVVNPGLTAAVVLVGLAYGVSVGVMSTADNATSVAARVDLPILQATADAQRQAHRTRSAESQIVLTREADGAAAQRWTEAADEVSSAVDRVPTRSRIHLISSTWNLYRVGHETVAVAARNGRWDEARRLVTATDPGSQGDLFATFDAEISQEFSSNSEALSGSLLDARRFVTAAAIIALLASGAAVAGTFLGLRARLREYA